MAVTWNPADKQATVFTLSNGNLTVTRTAYTGTSGAVRATVGQMTGKWYWEIHCDNVSDDTAIGVNDGTNAANLASCPGLDIDGTGYLRGMGPGNGIYYNTNLISAQTAFATGDVVGIAIDVDAKTIDFYLNGAHLYTAAGANVPGGGTWYPSVGDTASSGSGVSNVTTANFGASAFVYTPPSGYLAYGANVFAMIGSGGVSVGGVAATYPTNVFIGEGGVSVGGSALVESHTSLLAEVVGSGGMSIGGSAVFEFTTPTIYDLSVDGVPQGGMRMGGIAVVAEKIDYVPIGGMQMGGSAIVLDRIPYTPSGGMLMGGAATVKETTNITPSGGTLMGGTAPQEFVNVYSPSGGMVMGGAATVSDYQAFYQPSGGMVMGGTAVAYMLPSYLTETTENPYGDPFPGWSVNTETHAATRYMNLPANSITRFQGRTFVSNAGGVYEMGADDDAGQPINASVELPSTDFATSYEKRMEKSYIGVRTPGKMRLKVKVKGKTPQYYVLSPTVKDYENEKGTIIPIGKGLLGVYWSARLDNVDGADFELASIEFNPVRGTRHGV